MGIDLKNIKRPGPRLRPFLTPLGRTRWQASFDTTANLNYLIA
jgi:hypothetical protein